MTDTFSYKNYSITTSLNERSIYFKLIDVVNYLSYEGNVELKELRVTIDLEGAYKIILNCFNEEENYSINISLNSGTIKMTFNALFGGFLKINFEILLREKLMSNDGQLTLNFNRIEQQQAQAIKALTEKCDKLEKMLVTQQDQTNKVLKDKCNSLETTIKTHNDQFKIDLKKMLQIIDNCQIFVSYINATGQIADLSTETQATQLINISKKDLLISDGTKCIYRNIASFYQLEKLTINNFIKPNLNDFKNDYLKELILTGVLGNNATSFRSLAGIQNFPNLEILTIITASSLTDVVKVLKETNNKKIKTLKFQTCAGINVVELQTYCQVNNIFLAIS
jgi:hypothetical protein